MLNLLNIRRIEDNEVLQQAFDIREKVFVEEQNVDPDEEYDEFEEEAAHYLAIYSWVPTGTARWRETDKGIKLERFAVLPAYRGKGIGTGLMNKMLNDILPADKPVYLHAQVQVIPFYEALGFVAEGDEFTEANIRHRKMYYRPEEE